MEEKFSGIVLGGINYGESDKILSIFTLEQGVISAKVKGVKKAGAKLKFASEPFCFAEFVLAKTSKNRTVIGASLIDSFYQVREDIVKYFCASVALEFVKKFCKEGIVAKNTFLLLIDLLKKLAYQTNPLSDTCAFLIGALALAGYAIKFNGCFSCGCELGSRVFFDYVFGGFFCDECKTDTCREINASTYISLNNIANQQVLENQNCVGALRLLDYYLTNKTEEKINSLKELLKII